MHNTGHMMNTEKRTQMGNAIVQAQQEAYEAQGVEGDWDDARRYYRDDASQAELIEDHVKWCK